MTAVAASNPPCPSLTRGHPPRHSTTASLCAPTLPSPQAPPLVGPPRHRPAPHRGSQSMKGPESQSSDRGHRCRDGLPCAVGAGGGGVVTTLCGCQLPMRAQALHGWMVGYGYGCGWVECSDGVCRGHVWVFHPPSPIPASAHMHTRTRTRTAHTSTSTHMMHTLTHPQVHSPPLINGP